MNVQLDPYSADWPRQFQQINTLLKRAIGHLNPVIEHIGSTSVPGLMAKPTIDIQIGMPTDAALDALHDCLLPHGFTRNARWDSNAPFRRFFVLLEQLPDGEPPPEEVGPEFKGDVRSTWISLANIHCVQIDHPWFADHLLFRDYLRTHEEDRDAYAELKQKLAGQEWEITADYAEAKTEFIEGVKKKAREWQKGLTDD